MTVPKSGACCINPLGSHQSSMWWRRSPRRGYGRAMSGLSTGPRLWALRGTLDGIVAALGLAQSPPEPVLSSGHADLSPQDG